MLRIVEVPSERLVLRRQLEVAIEQTNQENAHHDPNRADYRSGHDNHDSQHQQREHPGG
jgi:hypothetical protein